MNFFGLQDLARRDSLILMIAFTAAMLVFAWVVNISVAAFALIINSLGVGMNPKGIQILCIGIVWTYILYKCYERYREINQGGGKLAQIFGAERSTDNDITGREKILHNINAEMSVASTQTLMPCYILRNEPGINAFVLGDQKQPALVVTRGAVETLDRDELSALVAHEYAHVACDDLKLNMRMLIALGGLNAITEFGKLCFSDTHRTNHSIWSPSINSEKNNSIILLLLGTFCFLLGWVLTLFGEFIKSGFSRKREILADAKAVQFTRDPWGMASVIDKGTNHSKTPSLKSLHNGDLDHLCLLGPWGSGFFSGWLTNHPPPQSRIALLEPYFDIKKRSREFRRENQDTHSTSAAQDNHSMSIGESAMTVQEVENEIATVLSVMISTAGYNADTSQANFSSAMRSYSERELPLRFDTDPKLKQDFENALTTLMKQSPAQRVALVSHLQELMEHDGISTPEEKSVLAYVTEKLHPSSNAA